jgi:hypothetical protein
MNPSTLSWYGFVEIVICFSTFSKIENNQTQYASVSALPATNMLKGEKELVSNIIF